ncbi:hypothetical protein K490DRAFT_67061 [Saccharata proteae CBS 121410]|uniref:Uncharacterized protein n=1 Tax=Saccharata proteae CBS 121410 TaxID=1314787 RepID=A0A9P4HQP6_9PEZI|nr:hypothetical protein K490DRAFT_67061 [Saccharata proteae CBS 121410]
MSQDRRLPPLRSLNLNQDGPHEMRRHRSPMGNPGQAPLTHGHHSLGLMERYPSSDSFSSSSSQQYAIAYRGPQYQIRKDSLNAMPSPVMTPSAMPTTTELKEECPRCGSHIKPFSDCACGHVAFRHPFQNGKRLADDSDDYFDPRPTSRRGSGISSSSSNPPSRQGSYISYPGIPKPTRRESTQTIKPPGQTENHRKVKAEREKDSRKEITSGMKRMEVYLVSVGLSAATDLNANNKSKSGLNFKKAEILALMMQHTRDENDELWAAYDQLERLSAMQSAGRELGEEELENLRQARENAQRRKAELDSFRRKEEALIEHVKEQTESRNVAEAAPKSRSAKPRPRRTGTAVRCASPGRSASPGYSNFPY